MAEDALDEALEVLADSGPIYGPSDFVNHGPMAAEAMLRLGYDDQIVPWVRRYAASLAPAPEPAAPVSRARWSGALGAGDLYASWLALFRAELRDADWPDVVRLWLPRLMPGLAAAAAHGLIETAHAVRALAHEVTPLRVDELARGLALWASRYKPLASRGRAEGGVAPSEALGRVDLPAPGTRPSYPSLDAGLDAAARSGGVADVAAFVDASADPAATLDDLIRAFVGITHTQAVDVGSAIAFVHSVTGPCAVQVLLGRLDREAQTAAVEYVWQVSAGLYIAFGDASRTEPEPEQVSAPDAVARAIASDDEHAIKFAEAALRSDREGPLRAAAVARVAAALAPAPE